MLGTVKSYVRSTGYGFISPDGGGKEIYVHARQIVGEGDLLRGDRVEFDPLPDRKYPGRIEAKNVRLIV